MKKGSVKRAWLSGKGIKSLVILCIACVWGMPVGSFAEVEDEVTLQTNVEQTDSHLQKRPWYKRFFCKPTWEQMVVEGDTPENICALVGKHIGYASEEVDLWTPAEETWSKGSGDCEDFALCVLKVCQDRGYSAAIHLFYSLKDLGQGHAVVIGELDGKLWVSSNGDFEIVESIDGVKERVANALDCTPGDLWSVNLDSDDVTRFVSGSTIAPVASE